MRLNYVEVYVDYGNKKVKLLEGDRIKIHSVRSPWATVDKIIDKKTIYLTVDYDYTTKFSGEFRISELMLWKKESNRDTK